jgi:alanine racemase
MHKKLNTKGLRTWIEIDTNALSHNFNVFRSKTGATKIMGIVKSNAYGHGLVEMSKELVKRNVDWLGVDSVVEALRLRKEGIKIPILVLGYTLPERVKEAVENNISLTASTREFLDSCEKLKLKQKIKIHLKVDTGLHRQGFLEDDREEVFSYFIKEKTAFELEGLFTHFAQAKKPDDRAYTESQLEKFFEWVRIAKEHSLAPVVHAGASAGAFVYPEAHFDMVRVGAGLYGIWPSADVKKAYEKEFQLKPVLSWRTIIAERKALPKGAGIGYDLAETLSKDSVIAICPIGYWHGFSRSLSSVGEVLVLGKRTKVLGIVAMDMIVIDITDIKDAKVGTPVTLIGIDGTETITAEEMATKAGTTAYEALTRLNPLIKKLYY